ncbi:GntR family transcriptional regulator [Streptomyces sp. ODS28]|uniref:GntR family transcriptional regulator n=1 Tax=Streptomyces sp. ODS28 TaxID=3136688 RepID=UPI0031E5BE21
MPETARQIADELRARIDSGALAPGDRLPGEPTLVREYGVAKETANKALKLLVSEGLAVRRHGSGTYVRSFRPIRRVAPERTSRAQWQAGAPVWSAETEGREFDVTVEVYEEPASQLVARALSLDENTAVLVRDRRYVVDGEPVQLATSYLPAALVTGSPIANEDPGPGGTYARLAELGHAPAHFTEELRSRLPDQREAELLALPTGIPLLEICRTALTAEHRPVEFTRMLLDAGSYVLEYRFDA